MTTYGTIRTEWLVRFRVVELNSPFAVLGLLVLLRHEDPQMGGGYALSGPKDVMSGATLQAAFPATDDDLTLPSLAYDASHPFPADRLAAAIAAIEIQADNRQSDTRRRYVWPLGASPFLRPPEAR